MTGRQAARLLFLSCCLWLGAACARSAEAPQGVTLRPVTSAGG